MKVSNLYIINLKADPNICHQCCVAQEISLNNTKNSTLKQYHSVTQTVHVKY